jgi:hypothetical protein
MYESPESAGSPTHDPDDADGTDATAVRAEADAVMHRTAEELRAQLRAVAAQIDPFPAFPGAVFAYGIEVEPRSGGSLDLGCVILGDDGALYELEIGLDDTTTQQAVADASTERHEELVALDVPADVFVVYAHAALHAAADYLEGPGSRD